MPRIISSESRSRIIQLMLSKNHEGKYLFSQRDIERETGLSRPYIRKLAREVGHVFPINGIDIKGQVCVCTNCGGFFYRPKSKVIRAKNQFCSDDCRFAWSKGVNHPSWTTGQTANTFSSWVKNQSQYDKWREEVLKRDNYQCVISGKTENLHAHHILHKAEQFNPEKVFDVDNGITLNEEVHREIHKLTREGNSYEKAVEILKDKYQCQV